MFQIQALDPAESAPVEAESAGFEAADSVAEVVVSAGSSLLNQFTGLARAQKPRLGGSAPSRASRCSVTGRMSGAGAEEEGGTVVAAVGGGAGVASISRT